MSEAILEVEKLDAYYGQAQILFEVSLKLRRGEIIARGRPEEVRANARVREVYLGGSAAASTP